MVGSNTASNTFVAPVGIASVLTGGTGDDTFIIPANAGDVTVTGGGGADDLQIYAAGNPETFASTNPDNFLGDVDTTVTGAFATHTVHATGINTLELTGGLIVPASVSPGMTDPGGTTATLDFSGGNPIPAGGVTFTGGGGTNPAFISTLVLENDIPSGPPSFANEVYNATGPGAGDITFNDAPITSDVPSATNSVVFFSGLSPVIDSVGVVNYTFNAPLAPPQGNNIAITSDPSVNGFAGTLIASTDTPAGFESAAVANKTNVTVNSILPSNTAVTVNDPTPGAGLTTLAINTGAGNDFINLVSTPTAVSLAANSGDGTDTFNVEGTGLGGPASINGGTATNTLIFDASGNTVTEVPGANSTLPSTLTAGISPTLTFTNFTTVDVNNIADLPLTNTPAAITVQEGQTFSGVVGSFAVTPDPNPGQINPTAVASDFVATIDWGDGTTTSGTIVANGSGGFDVYGTHTYALATTPGTDPITVTVTHNASTSTTTANGTTTTLMTPGGSTTTIASTATVTDAPITVVPAPVLATEGTPIPAGTLLATFTDPNPFSVVGSFTGTVDWGDGTGVDPVAVTITPSTVPGTYLVFSGAPHTYAVEGLYNVTVTIAETGGLTAVSTGTATVKAATLTLTVTPPTTITDGNSFTGQVATFTDANAAGTVGQFQGADQLGRWVAEHDGDHHSARWSGHGLRRGRHAHLQDRVLSDHGLDHGSGPAGWIDHHGNGNRDGRSRHAHQHRNDSIPGQGRRIAALHGPARDVHDHQSAGQPPPVLGEHRLGRRHHDGRHDHPALHRRVRRHRLAHLRRGLGLGDDHGDGHRRRRRGDHHLHRHDPRVRRPAVGDWRPCRGHGCGGHSGRNSGRDLQLHRSGGRAR